MQHSSARPIVTSLGGVADEHILTSCDVSALMSVSQPLALELLASGRIDGVFKFGSQMRISAGDLRKYMVTNKVKCSKK
jgi:excisionase family DNA binding protein